MGKEPLFSIAIPTYNRLEMLKKAVDSALKQIYSNIEIIILNNCSTDGTKEWYNEEGELHREDGPAFIDGDPSSGDKRWYKNGYPYRKDGKPTVEWPDGSKEWRHRCGYLHREDGPAFEDADGTKEWHLNGLHHRIGKPATEYADGSKEWWVDGQHHREDGPAVEYLTGNIKKEWWLNGEEVTQEEFEKRKK